MKYFITTLFLSFNLTYAVTLTSKVIRGTGCNEHNSSVTNSPDNKLISIIYDDLNVEVPNEAPFIRGVHMGPQKTVKHCTLTFSLSTDENHYIESIEVTNQLRGALFIDDGVRANFRSQLLKKPTLLRGRISSLEDKSWQDFSDEEIFINSKTYFDLQQSCGRADSLDFKFRNTLTIDMNESSYYSGAMGFLSIDSTDTSGNFKIKVNYKRCSRSSYRKNYSQNSRMDRVRQICERNGGRLVGTRCLR